MDFGALPPEINSARMYSGPGAGPMMAAAAAWNSLGSELTDTATSYESVTSALTGEEWLGSASTAMAGAITPYVAWMTSTAAALEHAAAQAMASAAAYEEAFAMTVPPPVIAANRAQLAALVATNIVGQNTPAIAATEAHYGQMWAQDTAAMFGYAGSSANAATLDPLVSPTSTVDPAGSAGSAVAAGGGTQSGLSQLVAELPGTMQSMTSPSGSTGGFLTDAISSTQNIGIWNGFQTATSTAGQVVAWNVFAAIASGIGQAEAASLSSSGGAGAAGMGTAPALVGATAPAGAANAASTSAGGAPVLASVGKASSVGELAVPAGWSAATPAESGAAAATEATGWSAGVEEGAAMEAMPAGMPAMASAHRGNFGFGTPRYGFKPKVMARPYSAG